MVIESNVAKKSFKELLESKASEKKSRAVTVRLPADVDMEIKKLAKTTNRTVTDVIVEALRFALEIPS